MRWALCDGGCHIVIEIAVLWSFIIMNETPKKLSHRQECCFLRKSLLTNDRDKIRVFGKSDIYIPSLILRATKLDLAHYVGCDKFAICCVSCYKRLTRYKNALQKVKDIEYEIAPEFNLLLPVSVKRMAKDVEENVLQTSKRSLTYEGSNVKPVAITSEVLPLASDTEEFNLDGSVSKPNASAFGVPGHIFGGGTCSLIASNINSNTVHQPAEGCIKIAKSPKSCEIKTSTPINKAKPPTFEQPDIEPVKKQTKVFLTVQYLSKTVRKELTDDFATLGKAIAHGSPQRIAKAALKIVTLKKHILEKVLKLLSLQVSGLCSRRNPSMLLAKTKEDFASFEFQNLRIYSPVFKTYAYIRLYSKPTHIFAYILYSAISAYILCIFDDCYHIQK